MHDEILTTHPPLSDHRIIGLPESALRPSRVRKCVRDRSPFPANQYGSSGTVDYHLVHFRESFEFPATRLHDRPPVTDVHSDPINFNAALKAAKFVPPSVYLHRPVINPSMAVSSCLTKYSPAGIDNGVVNRAVRA